MFFFLVYGAHRDFTVLTHSFPPRRSSDLQQVVVRGHRDDGHVRIDQGQRPMLELAGGIGLGMDIGNLLELERTFQRDRKQRATTEEQRSEEHTSELQSLMRISYAVFCLKKKKTYKETKINHKQQKK